ncbi:hypothetical protein [Algoriphagus boritolerans]|uniref:murein hydrolase activator EnvC family protein n=1 Tax=Algoriphagus boritolerans TaxID=308111 RepID=UPI002FCE32AC
MQARLREFDAILKQTSATKQTSLGELNALTRQFQTQNRLVNTLDREVRLINQEISETEKKIIALETQLKDLKAEYSRMIYNSSKLNRGLSIVAFVFSSGNFNQLYMRLKYLKQYSDSRKQQAEQIEKLSAELGDQRALLDKKKKPIRLPFFRKNKKKELSWSACGKVSRVSSIRFPEKKEISSVKSLQPKKTTGAA